MNIVDDHRIGALCEAIVRRKLISDGYWVFGTTMGGPVDLIAIKGDPAEIKLIDVKHDYFTARKAGRARTKRRHRARSETQKRLNVQIVYVEVETETVYCPTHNV